MTVCSPAPVRSAQRAGLQKLFVVALVALLPLKALGASIVSPGEALAAVIGLVMFSAARHYRRGYLIVTLMGIALAVGLAFPTIMGIEADTRAATRSAGLFALFGLHFAALLWARRLIGDKWTAVAYGLGTALQVLLVSQTDNPWKYGLGWGVSVAALALFDRGRAPATITALALAAWSVLHDSRSLTGFLLLAALLILWRAKGDAVTRDKVLRLGVALLAIWGLYQACTALALQGAFGQDIQWTTYRQAQQAEGNAILGARMESAGTIGLVKDYPLGIGVGTIPNGGISDAIRSGMAGAGVNLDSSYVTDYMLKDRVELHSTVADMWASFSLAGVALAVALIVLIVRAFVREVTQGRARAVVLFVVLSAAWDLAFSPMLSNLPMILFAVAITLPLQASQPD